MDCPFIFLVSWKLSSQRYIWTRVY